MLPGVHLLLLTLLSGVHLVLRVFLLPGTLPLLLLLGGHLLGMVPLPIARDLLQNHSPPANNHSGSDCEDSDNPRPPVHHHLYGGPGSTSHTDGSGTRGGVGGVVRQGSLVGGVGSGIGDGSGSEESDARGVQGDHDTRHVGTGGDGGSSSTVGPGPSEAHQHTLLEPGLPRLGLVVVPRGGHFSRLVVWVCVVGVGLVGAQWALAGVVGAVVAVGYRRAPGVAVGGRELVLVGALPPTYIRGLSLSFS